MTKTVAAVLFLLTVTRTEFPGSEMGAGLATLLRVIFAWLLVFLCLADGRRGIPPYAALVGFVIGGYMLALNIADPTIFGLVVPVGMTAGAILGYLGLHGSKDTFLSAIRVYVLLNIAGLVIEWAFYLYSRQLIDLHGLLFPWSQARVEVFLGYPRMTGFQVEPGTYANTIFLLVIISGILRGQLWGWVEGIAIASTIFTFSAWAVLGGVAYLIGVLLQEVVASARRGLFVVFLLALVCSFLPLLSGVEDGGYAEYVFARFDVEDGSGSINQKVQAWAAWKENLWLPMMVGHSLPDLYCETCSSPQDLGTGLNLAYTFGLIVSVPLVWLAMAGIKRRLGWPFVVASMPLITAKFFMYDPAIWIFVGMGLFLHASRFRKAGGGHYLDISNRVEVSGLSK